MYTMFHSARIKLTAFYLTVLLVFSLALTIGVRSLAQYEYERSNVRQRGEVQQMIYQLLNPPASSQDFDFQSIQQQHENMVRKHLNQELVVLNLVALVVGGAVSYWYAGRTLRPIMDAHDAQKRFASDASHELRTPLTNIKVENEVFLRQKTFTEAEARDQIKSNLEEVQRLENLSSNLLAITQYEHASLTMKDVDAAKLVQEAVSQTAKAYGSRGIIIEQSVKSANVHVHSDSVIELFAIVLDNAAKYSPQGGTVRVKGARQGSHYTVQIIDEGHGIAEEDLPKIFDRLYRGDKARSSKIEGYGLGLALAKQIASVNHGTISAHNNRGKGARFVIELPLK